VSTPSTALERPSGLLPQDPPARAALWAGRAVLALALAVAAFASLVPLPQVVEAPFELLPGVAADELRVPVDGELLRIAVAEGDRVEAGALLFEIRADGVREGQSRLRQWREQRRALDEQAQQSDAVDRSTEASLAAQTASAERALQFAGERLATQRDLLSRAEQLGSRGVLPEIERLRYRLALDEAQRDRVLAEQQREQARLAQQQHAAEQARRQSREQSEAQQLDERIANAERELADSDGDQRQVRAPYAAFVLRLPTRAVGSVLARGEQLAQLVPADATLKARIALPEAALPRLQPGQRVRLQLEAYPYQRHGSLEAELGWISPAPVHDGSQAGFIAEALPAAAPWPLRAGMRGTARITIERRTLVERALEPLRGLRERVRG